MESFYIRVDVGVIFIRLPISDDASFSQDDWANDICKEYPGPFNRLILDLNSIQTVNSIICAGFIHLYRHYQCDEAVLANVSSNVKSILHTLQLDKIFNIEYKD
jgi:hypothetical protein